MKHEGSNEVMETKVEIFKNDTFGNLRTVEKNGKILFIASDVAKLLGYTNSSKAINDHCRYVTKCYIPHPQGKGMLEVNIIPEGDVYRLIAHSKLPSAEKFESWVFDEALPTIRRTGSYMMPDFNNPAEAARAWANEYEAKQKALVQVAVMKPKVLFAEAVDASQNFILIGDLAKLLKQNGVETGQKKLFAWLRDNDYLIKSGSSKNMPTQRAMEMGLFEVKEGTFVNKNDVSITTRTTKVTGKGQIFFINKFLQ